MNRCLKMKAHPVAITSFFERLRDSRIPFVVATEPKVTEPWRGKGQREWWGSRQLIEDWNGLIEENPNIRGTYWITFWLRERDFPLTATMAPSSLLPDSPGAEP